MSYLFRRAGPADATGCVEVLRSWIEETPWMPMLHDQRSMELFWRERLEIASAWVATKDGVVQGFCVRDTDVVTALYVGSDARGQGVGKHLLDLAKDGCDRFTLWTFAANVEALTFYARQGFTEVRRTDGDNEECLPDVELEWQQARIVRTTTP